jgi:hypothetical protein
MRQFFVRWMIKDIIFYNFPLFLFELKYILHELLSCHCLQISNMFWNLMQACWFIIRRFNVANGMQSGAWALGFKVFSNFLNMFWILECLFGFVLCIVQYAHVQLCALCTMPLYNSMIHCLKLEYLLDVVGGLELQICSGLWCKHIDIATRQISFETWVQIFEQCLSLAMCIWYMFV